MSFQEDLVSAIGSRVPIALLIGQHAWDDAEGSDPILRAALEHLLHKSSPTEGWSALWGDSALPVTFFSWLGERFARRPVQSWVEELSTVPWSAVFTSSLDPQLVRQLSNSYREPQAILTATEVPTTARSTVRTPIYYLFGRAGISDTLAAPPRSRMELRVRYAQHAVPMLNRVNETATAVGYVVIDGLDLETDWVHSDSVLALIGQMPEGHVFWTGWKNLNTPVGRELEDLLAEKKARISSDSLGAILASLRASGRLSDVENRPTEASSAISLAADRTFEPTPELRIKTEAVASIVDDSWVAFLPPLGKDAEYHAFRQFHGDFSGPKGMVRGIRYGFSIERDFELALREVTSRAVAEHARYDEPIIVHGQSGTGKTIALARLVSVLKDAKKAALLYSTSRVPQSADVDAFCESAEEAGALVTVVVCDANSPLGRYRELLIGLRSRGRKVVLVGSSYRQVDIPRAQSRSLIEAPDLLSESEFKTLESLVVRFGGEWKNSADGLKRRNVLATLYRQLPSSRFRLATGLGGEARATEIALRERGKQKATAKPLSILGEQLVQLGLAPTIFDADADKNARDQEDSAGTLVDLVMAAGKLDCAVPINLLMRALATATGSIDTGALILLFEGLDLFRWRRSENEGEEYLVSPRLTLEAELICERRLATPENEGEQLAKLIRAARLVWDPSGTERRFVLDLVHRLGPDGPRGTRYKDRYLRIAAALSSLRTDGGVRDPSIMLQESVLRRSAIREGSVPDSDALRILDEARIAVESGIDLLAEQTGRGSRRARANLSVERAAIFGFLARFKAIHDANPQEVWSAYQAARVAARSAASLTDTYFPLDISLWVPSELLEKGGLAPEQMLELRADIFSVLDHIDPESLPWEQQERFEKRRFSLGQVMQDQSLVQDAIAKMGAINTAAALYLKARSIGPNLAAAEGPDFDLTERQRASAAANVLKSSWAIACADDRCLRYFICCRWIAAVGHHPLKGEREPLPTEKEAISELLAAVRDFNSLAEGIRDNGMVYLQAVLSWVADDEMRALEIWRDLAHATDLIDPKRVIRRHVLVGADGSPVLFSGRIESDDGRGRFQIRLESGGWKIPLLSRDFPQADLAYGRTVTNFAIAFNFIGPIAEPLRRTIRS